MIKVHSPVEVEAEPSGGWQITLWAGTAFDYSTPFRSMLAEIAHFIEPEAALELPPIQEHEDFIEGRIHVGDLSLRTYYEYALGYLAIMGDSEHDLSLLLTKLEPHIALVNDL